MCVFLVIELNQLHDQATEDIVGIVAVAKIMIAVA
jgi:hypothetical protein